MNCDIKNCKNKGCKTVTKDLISSGINVEKIILWVCNNHTQKEIDENIQKAGEEKAFLIQDLNPFVEVQQMIKL